MYYNDIILKHVAFLLFYTKQILNKIKKKFIYYIK